MKKRTQPRDAPPLKPEWDAIVDAAFALDEEPPAPPVTSKAAPEPPAPKRPAMVERRPRIVGR